MGLALLGGVLTLVNLDNLGTLLKQCRFGPLFHAFLLFLGGTLSSSIAWQILLVPLGYRIRLWQSLRLSLVGFFLNNLVPSGVGGDVFRIWAAGTMGVNRVHAAASVFVERWSAFLALFTATFVSYVLAFPLLHGVEVGSVLGRFWAPLARIRLDMLMGGFLVFMGLAFIASTSLALYLGSRRSPWVERFSFGVPAQEFFEAVSVYRRHCGLFLVAATVNWASPLLEGLAFSSIADALGLNLSPLLFLAFTPIFRVLNHLPVSVNAVGTQEIASLVFWQPLGAQPDEAVAISILIHALKVSVSMVGAPFYFVGRGYRVESLVEVPSASGSSVVGAGVSVGDGVGAPVGDGAGVPAGDGAGGSAGDGASVSVGDGAGRVGTSVPAGDGAGRVGAAGESGQ